jgi:hypothetical protein
MSKIRLRHKFVEHKCINWPCAMPSGHAGPCDSFYGDEIEEADEDGPLDLEDQLDRALDKAFGPLKK